VMESSPLRAIQAASNAIQLLNSGFTVIRDVGNNANYADCALRQAIEQGWLPGPTVIPSGPMIGSTGGQFWPTPEMYKDHKIMYPEYIDANSPEEIVRAVRENMLFGARTIKLCIDCKPWGYSVDDIKLAISEAAKGGCKVEGHVQTPEGAQRAIDAGIYIIAHGNALTPEHHRQMIEDRYAPLGAQQMFADGKRTSRVAKLLAGPLTYLRSLVLKGGWRDGQAGLKIAKLAAHHASLKHEILYQIQNQHRDDPARN